MAKPLSAIKQHVRQKLLDEFVAGSTTDFEDDEINVHINEFLVELSESSPREVKETVQTTASSRDLDISSITDLLDVEYVEYKTGKDPKEFRNVKRFGDTLTMDIATKPAVVEDAYVYCLKVHTLTETSSSLNPQMERILTNGATGLTALGWLNNIRIEITNALTTLSTVDTAVGEVTARVTQAVTDLTSGRASIGSQNAAAVTAIGEMTARITQAASDMTTGRALIADQRDEAITAIDNVNDRITQALADLTSGRALINLVNVGGAPEDDYAAYAGRELQAATEYMAQARAFLSSDMQTGEYQRYAARELDLANSHRAQAGGYLAVDVPVDQYRAYAAAELNNATASLNKAGGYLNEIRGRLSTISAMNAYHTWANNQLAMAREDLRKLVKPRVYKEYPRT